MQFCCAGEERVVCCAGAWRSLGEWQAPATLVQLQQQGRPQEPPAPEQQQQPAGGSVLNTDSPVEGVVDPAQSMVSMHACLLCLFKPGGALMHADILQPLCSAVIRDCLCRHSAAAVQCCHQRLPVTC